MWGLVFTLPATAANRLFAVLPLDVRMTQGRMSEAARASIEEMLRDEAANRLAQTGWTVVTGEATLQVLADNGVNSGECNDEACHFSVARELAADKFISGSVQFADDEFTASVRLIDTQTGRILSSEHINGKSARELRDALQPRIAGFFTRAALNESPDAPQSVADPASSNGTVIVNSLPPGATVTVDGTAVGVTPLTQAMAAGSYDLGFELPGYVPVWKPLVVEAGHESTVSTRMVEQRLFARVLNDGYIEVSATPAAASITIDGKPSGVGRQGPFAFGRHIVRAEAPGYTASEMPVIVGATPAAASLELSHGTGSLMVATNVAADCTAQGVRVRVNPLSTEKIEVTPGSVSLACTRLGYERTARLVIVGAGELVFVAMTLVPREGEPAPAETSSDPSDATGGLEITVHQKAPPTFALPSAAAPQEETSPGVAPVSFVVAAAAPVLPAPQRAETTRTEPKSGQQFVALSGAPGRSDAAVWFAHSPVTVAAFARCVQAGGCRPKSVLRRVRSRAWRHRRRRSSADGSVVTCQRRRNGRRPPPWPVARRARELTAARCFRRSCGSGQRRALAAGRWWRLWPGRRPAPRCGWPRTVMYSRRSPATR
jgi:TolB-like protein